MPTFVLRNGELIDRDLAPPLVLVHGRAPAVHSDSMPHTLHHADGQHYDSKAKYREVTRAHGCVEIGNEKLAPRKHVQFDKRKRRDDIRRAIGQLRS